MFRWLVLVIALGLGVVPARASVDAVYIGLHELCLEADAIVVGRIVALDDENFEVAITRQIAGVTLPARVKLSRFDDWTCGQRWAPYALGQELLLFLERSSDGKRLDPIGGTCEGEMPILDGQVGCPYLLHDVPTVRITLEKHVVGLRLVPLAEFEEAIRFVRERFECVPWSERSPGSIVPLWPMDEIEAFGRSSKVAWHLIDELYSSEYWKGPIPDDGPRLAQDVIERVTFADGETSAIRRLACIGELDGAVDVLATLNNPEALALVHVSPEGAPSFAAIAIENLRADFTLGTCVPLGDLDANGELDFVLHVGRPGIVQLSLSRQATKARWRAFTGFDVLREAGLTDRHDITEELTNIGDLDGDGMLELATLVRERRGPGEDARSIVFVLSLDRSGRFVRALRWNDTNLPSCDPLWLSLAAIGDVDGDGVNDVALGDSADDLGNRMRGAVWIVFLARDGSVRSARKFSSLTGGFRHRLVDRESLGDCLAGPGDVDGDSIPDLLASSDSGLWTLLLARDGSVRSVRRLRNPADPEPPGSFLGDIATSPLSLGRALTCTPARPGSPAFVFSGAFLRSERRTGLLALGCGSDGTLTLR